MANSHYYTEVSMVSKGMKVLVSMLWLDPVPLSVLDSVGANSKVEIAFVLILRSRVFRILRRTRLAITGYSTIRSLSILVRSDGSIFNRSNSRCDNVVFVAHLLSVIISPTYEERSTYWCSGAAKYCVQDPKYFAHCWSFDTLPGRYSSPTKTEK